MTQRVFGFHYTLKDKEGNVIDSSENAAPLLFLEASGHIIPGLEKELLGFDVGDKKNIQVKADEAYGEVVEHLKITVQKSQFPEGQELNIGDQFQVTNEQHAPVFTVVEIQGEDVHVDGNHPLAGHDLFFDVEITEKRAATEEEVAHGHAHGPGGHHH